MMDKPWFVDCIKEVGGLGLVLIMLVGLYFLGDTYLSQMNDTWKEISEMTKEQNVSADADRELVRKTVTAFMSEQNVRLNDLTVEMSKFDDRLDALEQQ